MNINGFKNMLNGNYALDIDLSESEILCIIKGATDSSEYKSIVSRFKSFLNLKEKKE